MTWVDDEITAEEGKEADADSEGERGKEAPEQQCRQVVDHLRVPGERGGGEGEAPARGCKRNSSNRASVWHSFVDAISATSRRSRL